MTLISFEESMKLLNQRSLSTHVAENVFLEDALGRVLAEDIIAPANSPIAPTSAMDGYAVRAKDLSLGKLHILKDNPAGAFVEDEVSEGICIKTFTGALMPKGSDTLIPIENVRVEGNEIIIEKIVPEGFAVRPIGEEYKCDEVLITKGTTISYAHIGVMASINKVMLKVARRPRIAILATGNEVLDLAQEAQNPSQIRSSNSYTLAALARTYGAEVIPFGIVKDDKASISKAFNDALEVSDIVVTTGGVSVGDYDFVKDVILESGATKVFQRVGIKPGRHVVVAQKENKFIVGLPGFAYSSTVTFILYVLPLINKFLQKEEQALIVDAQLKQDYKKRSPFTEFTACNVSIEKGRYYVDLASKKEGSSAILTNMLTGKALLMLDASESDKHAGEFVKVLLLA